MEVLEVDEGPASHWKLVGEQMGGVRAEQTTEEAMKELMVGGAMKEMIAGGAMEEMMVEGPMKECMVVESREKRMGDKRRRP